ncbi:P-loop NTPase family protein [Pseudochryseolinea flava]|uniref:CobQ/CobB/MinD/ParA nucleotide binding domain-containing protein n=1 Tax=Pseudochryseolinea flava TaxID=2059302 RepID=A0A364XZ73_9BACT|nr:hypothetical protein [Pseudochryseolinea flava]RAV99662.1 hypothetical protein DQQ10_18890 [Pseudochryseolinea flava]
MKKKIQFITQAKGGAGKSLLTFILAEKYQDAIILDLDDANRTTSKQLAYRNPTLIPFLDPTTQRIDRGTFMELFRSISTVDHELFIADLGASLSEQLPKFFVCNDLEATVKLLSDNNIQLQLVCVIGGANIFNATMSYLVELVTSVQGCIEIIAAYNGMFPCTTSQQDVLSDYVAKHKIPLIPFDLSPDKNDRAMRNIEMVLREGQGLSKVSPFITVYFDKSIKNLKL